MCMNLANRLTTSRIFLSLALILILRFPGVLAKAFALSIFLLATLTDYWDGRIARQRNQITPLGRFLDPVADKVLTFSAFCGFLELGLIPAWMVVVIVTRDLLITGLRLMMPAQDEKVAARKSGKHKTVIQYAAIILILIYLTFHEMPFWQAAWTPLSLKIIYSFMLAVVVATLYSGSRYLYLNREFFSGSSSK